MFWAFLLIVSLAVMLLKLGAMSVWVSVLSAALQLAMLALLGWAVFAAWQYFRRR